LFCIGRRGAVAIAKATTRRGGAAISKTAAKKFEVAKVKSTHAALPYSEMAVSIARTSPNRTASRRARPTNFADPGRGEDRRSGSERGGSMNSTTVEHTDNRRWSE